MNDVLIREGAGYGIWTTTVPGTMTNYGRSIRSDGSINHGFVDLRDRPELVDKIPETSKSAGLAEILRAVNAKGSPLFSITCESHEFQLDEPRYDGTTVHVGGFVDISFRDQDKASDQSRFIDLADWILGGIPAPAEGIAIAFEFMVEPLKNHFGRTDCYGLMVKPHGWGKTPDEAWKAFDYAAAAAAKSLARANST